MVFDPGKAQFKPAPVTSYETRIALKKFDATSPPTSGADMTAGWSAGSLWYDSTAGKLYVCTDATAGAAVWKEIAVGTGALTPLTQFYTDVNGVSSDYNDAYSFTIPAGTLTKNGDSLHAVYAGTTNATNIMSVEAFFAGTSVFNSDEITTIGAWKLKLEIVRTSATTARCTASWLYASYAQTQYTSVTSGLDFTTGEILKLRLYAEDTGTDLVAKMGKVWKIAAA